MLRKNQHALKKMHATIFSHLFNELSFDKNRIKIFSVCNGLVYPDQCLLVVDVVLKAVPCCGGVSLPAKTCDRSLRAFVGAVTNKNGIICLLIKRPAYPALPAGTIRAKEENQ